MDRAIVYIIFILLILLSILISTMACMFCRKWHKAYFRLKNKYEITKKENIKLQHDLYRLTYITPSVDTKKGRKENGK